MRKALGALLVVLGMAGLPLFSACGGGSEPEPEGDDNGSLFSETVTSKLAAALGLEGPESILWEKESSSAWRDAQLFANRILGETEVPALDEMEISVLEDEASGDGRTVVIRVQVADLTADYRISMREVPGQWRGTSYEGEKEVEGMGAG